MLIAEYDNHWGKPLFFNRELWEITLSSVSHDHFQHRSVGKTRCRHGLGIYFVIKKMCHMQLLRLVLKLYLNPSTSGAPSNCNTGYFTTEKTKESLLATAVYILRVSVVNERYSLLHHDPWNIQMWSDMIKDCIVMDSGNPNQLVEGN